MLCVARILAVFFLPFIQDNGWKDNQSVGSCAGISMDSKTQDDTDELRARTAADYVIICGQLTKLLYQGNNMDNFSSD